MDQTEVLACISLGWHQPTTRKEITWSFGSSEASEALPELRSMLKTIKDALSKDSQEKVYGLLVP